MNDIPYTKETNDDTKEEITGVEATVQSPTLVWP